METLNGFEIKEHNVHGIKPGATTWTCPVCSPRRKLENQKAKCMSVFWDTGLGQCNHCGETVQLHNYKRKEDVKKYLRPVLRPVLRAYSDKFISYLTKTRAIQLNVLESFKIREVSEWMPQTTKEENCIAFDYYYKGVLINTKFRDGKKNFKLVKDAEKILYNLDAIVNQKEALFVEGEIDVLSWASAGYNFAVSVPNGFNLKGNVNLEYLDNYGYLFEDKELIYIGVDNDEAGTKGQQELIRRLGSEKCRIIDYKDCKDANEFLIKYGPVLLLDLLKTAKEVQVDGIFRVQDVEKEMFHSFLNGQKRGTTTYFPEIDKIWTWRETEVNLWTGYQNEGKSLWLLQLSLIRAIMEEVKVAVFCPENMPVKDFFNDLIESFIGKSSDPYYSHNYMQKWEYQYAMNVINRYFFVIYPEKDYRIESIFEKTEYLIRKEGIRTLIIDPYNTVEHMMKPGEREDLYISRFMTQLKRFSNEREVSTHLVAHQLTAQKNKDDEGRYFKPDANKIKGGGTFADKADNVLFVWRPNRAIDFKNNEVIVGSQKIKKQKLVGIPGEVDQITFDIKTQRYHINGYSPFEVFDKMRHQDQPPKQDPIAVKNYYEVEKTDEVPF